MDLTLDILSTASVEKIYPHLDQFEAKGYGTLYKHLIDLGAQAPDLNEYPWLLESWILSMSGLSKLSVDLIQSTVENESVLGNEWVNQVTWEPKVMTGAEAQVMRKEFVSNCILRGCSPAFIEDSQSRWNSGLFSCVSSTHVVIGDVWATFPHPLVAKGSRSQFMSSPCQYDEIDLPAPYSDIGRSNLTMSQYRLKMWGSDLDDFYAVRPKINGERFVAVMREGKRFLSGFMDIEIPDDFAVEVSEYYAGKFYTIYPYGLPSFTYRELEFRSHPLMSVQDYRLKCFSGHKYDGLMLVTQRGEYRVKKLPTLEFDDLPSKEGVWECTWGYPWGGTVPQLVPLRPRPGKAVSKNVDRLHSMLTLKSLVPLLPLISWEVRVIESGYYKSPVAFRRVRADHPQVYIDSGCRLCQSKGYWTRHALVPAVNTAEGPLTLNSAFTSSAHFTFDTHQGETVVVPSPPKSQKHLLSSMKYHSGAKLFTYCPTTFRFLMIIDMDKNGRPKPIDFIGGTIEPGETPLMAMLRELWEEVKVKVAMDQLLSIGYTDDIDPTTNRLFRSHCYLMPWTSTKPANCAWTTLEYLVAHCEGKEYQEWVARHVKFFTSKVASVQDAHKLWTASRRSALGVPEDHLAIVKKKVNSGERLDLLAFLVSFIGQKSAGFTSSNKGPSYYSVVDVLREKQYSYSAYDLSMFPQFIRQGKGCMSLTSAGWALYWEMHPVKFSSLSARTGAV
jgi:ADP-ribose pyrophosphatase YjhB (NUDIX family)